MHITWGPVGVAGRGWEGPAGTPGATRVHTAEAGHHEGTQVEGRGETRCRFHIGLMRRAEGHTDGGMGGIG